MGQRYVNFLLGTTDQVLTYLREILVVICLDVSLTTGTGHTRTLIFLVQYKYTVVVSVNETVRRE